MAKQNGTHLNQVLFSDVEAVVVDHSDVGLDLLHAQLKELGQVGDDGNEQDGQGIANDAKPALATVDTVVVLDWSGDGQVPLHGQEDGHVDGAGHDNVVEAVERVAKQVLPSQR